MRIIKTRKDFISSRTETVRPLNEMFTNDVNWGDSLLGRLINSTIRKAGIMRNLNKMDIVIRALQEEFEKLSVTVNLEATSSLFYFQIAILLYELRENMKKKQTNSETISFIRVCIEAVRQVSPNTMDVSEQPEAIGDKNKVIKALENMIMEIENISDEQKEKIDDIPESQKKEILGLPEKEREKILALPVSEIGQALVALSKGRTELTVKDTGSEKVGTSLQKYVNNVELSVLNTVSGLEKFKGIKTDGGFSGLSAEVVEQLYGFIKGKEEKLKKMKKSLEDYLSNDEKLSEVNKKMFHKLSLELHPDKYQESVFYGVMGEEEVSEIMKKLNNEYDGKEKTPIVETVKIVLKIVNSLLEQLQKLEKLRKPETRKLNQENPVHKEDDQLEGQKPEVITSFKNDKVEFKVKNPGKEPDEATKEEWIRKAGGDVNLYRKNRDRKNKGGKNERVVQRWDEFMLIREKEETNTNSSLELFDSTMMELKEVVVDYQEKFGYMLVDSYTIEMLEARRIELEGELKTGDEMSIDYDPVMEIVRLFNRAYRLHTPGMIPSGRAGNRVSNSVFREYEYVGEKGTDGTPETPGQGPYRNIKLFEKWYDAVMDIIRQPKYQAIFNEKTSFRFSPADRRYNVIDNKKGGRVEGGGKALMAFMSACLDGSKMYRSGVQEKFFAKYFNFTLTDKGSTGYSMSDVSSNPVVAGEQKKSENVFEFREVNIRNKKDELKKGSVIRRGEGDVWTYFEVLKNDGGTFTMLVYGNYPYTKPSDRQFKSGSDSITKMDTSKVSVYLFKGTIDKLFEDKLKVKGIDEEEDIDIKGERYEVLYDDKDIYVESKTKYRDVQTKVVKLKEKHKDYLSDD